MDSRDRSWNQTCDATRLATDIYGAHKQQQGTRTQGRAIRRDGPTRTGDRRIDRRCRPALLKPEAGFIKLARASIVDYNALRRRLSDGRLRGVVLDLFDPEPLPPVSPLWAAPNVILTPNVSSDDEDNYGPLTIDLVFENIASWVAGKHFRNIVDRKLRC